MGSAGTGQPAPSEVAADLLLEKLIKVIPALAPSGKLYTLPLIVTGGVQLENGR